MNTWLGFRMDIIFECESICGSSAEESSLIENFRTEVKLIKRLIKAFMDHWRVYEGTF